MASPTRRAPPTPATALPRRTPLEPLRSRDLRSRAAHPRTARSGLAAERARDHRRQPPARGPCGRPRRSRTLSSARGRRTLCRPAHAASPSAGLRLHGRDDAERHPRVEHHRTHARTGTQRAEPITTLPPERIYEAFELRTADCFHWNAGGLRPGTIAGA